MDFNEEGKNRTIKEKRNKKDKISEQDQEPDRTGKIFEKTKGDKVTAKYFDQGDEVLLEVEGQATEFIGDGENAPGENVGGTNDSQDDSESEKSEEELENNEKIVKGSDTVDEINRNWNRSLDRINRTRDPSLGHCSRDDVVVLPRSIQDIEKERKEEEEGMH